MEGEENTKSIAAAPGNPVKKPDFQDQVVEMDV